MSGVRAAQHAGPRRGFEGQGGAHLAFVFLPRSSAPERVKGRRDALPLALCSKSSPLPGAAQESCDGPEERQDGVRCEISSRNPVKCTWGTHFPPLNQLACIPLAGSSSSARRRWHSPQGHRSPVRRRHDLRPQRVSPCMDGPSCAALARRAALRDHHTLRDRNACSKRLPCLSCGGQCDQVCLDTYQLPPGTLRAG